MYHDLIGDLNILRFRLVASSHFVFFINLFETIFRGTSLVAQVTTERTESQEVTTYLGPGGRVESQDEHDRRLAINAKMRFHRSLQSILF